MPFTKRGAWVANNLDLPAFAPGGFDLRGGPHCH